MKWSIVRIAAIAYGMGIAGSAAWHAIQTYVQYRTWRAHEIGSYLLPPHQSLSYFASYAWTNFWLPFVLSASASAGVWAAVRYGNARSRGKFFCEEEQFLAALGVLIVGYAYAVPYVVLVLATGFAGASVSRALKKEEKRTSLRMIWIPMALLLRIAAGLGI